MTGASHYWCTDSPRSGMYPDPTQYGNFTAHLDIIACNVVRHAMEHYWEQGVDSPLAPQTWATLTLYFEELTAFAALPGARAFVNATFVPVTRANLIGTPDAPGLLPTNIMKRGAVERVGGLNRLIRSLNMAPIPGFELDCSGSPW